MKTPNLPTHLYDFQRADTLELMAKPRRLFLEPMGAGKSVMCIAACDALDAFTIVIVCPSIMKADWQAKFAEFARHVYGFGIEARGRRVIVMSWE